jgi:hypothetical protein
MVVVLGKVPFNRLKLKASQFKGPYGMTSRHPESWNPKLGKGKAVCSSTLLYKLGDLEPRHDRNPHDLHRVRDVKVKLKRPFIIEIWLDSPSRLSVPLLSL